MISQKEAERLARKCLVHYAENSPEFDQVMDEANAVMSDQQWELVCAYQREADEWMGESEAGTLAQREKALAKAEGRKSRYPPVLYVGTEEERQRIISEIAADLYLRGIKYRA